MSPPIVLHVKRWISKSYSHCWKGFKYAENVVKPKNVQELGDFSEEQQAVELLRTNKGLMNNYHKTERQSCIIQETTQYSDSRVCKLLNGVIFIKSVIILSCGEYINICYVK